MCRFKGGPCSKLAVLEEEGVPHVVVRNVVLDRDAMHAVPAFANEATFVRPGAHTAPPCSIKSAWGFALLCRTRGFVHFGFRRPERPWCRVAIFGKLPCSATARLYVWWMAHRFTYDACSEPDM